MSARIISKEMANMIVSGLIYWSEIDLSEGQSFLNMMMVLNNRSVNQRYRENEPITIYEFEYLDCGFDNDSRVFLKIVKMIDIFVYQSCEVDFYEETLAMKILMKAKKSFLERYIKWLIKNGFNKKDWSNIDSYDLPFYDDVYKGY